MLIKRLLWVGVLILVVLVVRYFWRTTVNAQAAPIVAVSPAETDLFLNGVRSAQVSLNITNAVEIVGFDVVVTYDDALMTLDDWTAGSFLSSPWCITPVKNDGYIQVVCTQLNMVSGIDGVMFTLDFTGSSPGTSAIEIQKAELTDLDIQLILATKINGSANVSYQTSSVTGAVFLQGQSARAGVPISLGTGATYAQGPFTSLTTAALGQNLGLGAVVSNDTYTLSTAQPGYLNLNLSLAVTPGSDLTLPPLRLLAGDSTADNLIDTADLDAIRDAFDTHGAGIAADLNTDGVVNVQDLALAAGNYGLTPAEAYAGWVP